MPRPHADVLIVGAGPAGTACARHLAVQGLDVRLIDREPFPRYKTCGGGLIGRAMQRLADDDAIEAAIETRCHVAHLGFGTATAAFRTERSRPIVCMTMRSQLDTAMLAAAQRAGVAFDAPERLEGIEPTGSAGWLARTRTAALGVRWIVAADGALGTTARLAGLSDDRRLIPAVEYELEVDAGTFERFGRAARFDFGFDPSGYAWIFPKRRGLSVGILSHERRPDLHAKLARYLAAMQIRPRSEERHGFVIPVRPRRVVAARNLLLVGDVAGFADPVTAEGISAALTSGELAAEAIGAAARGAASDAADRYTRLVRQHLVPELRAARAAAALLYRLPRVRDRLFARHGQRLCEAVTDVMLGDATYRGLITNPRNYVRLLRRSAPAEHAGQPAGRPVGQGR